MNAKNKNKMQKLAKAFFEAWLNYGKASDDFKKAQNNLVKFANKHGVDLKAQLDIQAR